MEWVRLHFESVSGRSGYSDFYKRDVSVKVLDPVGTVIELWNGVGVQINEATFGDLSYEDGNPMEINLTLRADNWVLQFLQTASSPKEKKNQTRKARFASFSFLFCANCFETVISS